MKRKNVTKDPKLSTQEASPLGNAEVVDSDLSTAGMLSGNSNIERSSQNDDKVDQVTDSDDGIHGKPGNTKRAFLVVYWTPTTKEALEKSRERLGNDVHSKLFQERVRDYVRLTKTALKRPAWKAQKERQAQAIAVYIAKEFGMRLWTRVEAA